jgi:hypothetical protein
VLAATGSIAAQGDTRSSVSGPVITTTSSPASPPAPGLGSVGGSGNTVTVTGMNFPPNTDVTVTIFSSPLVLGTLTTNPSGFFAGSFAVPCTVPAGDHTVTASTAGGTTVSVAVTLTGCAAAAVLEQPRITG